ncbi:MAG: flippase [Candidatus Omnitrophica bacterium]|nr:flippase [Candidatus Omnitrophota bacterium]MDD5236449.1 flippase [Candidatus Omnitrophota bacterium]MDD5610515.1 flippase [Candidatus Omnitrophota bacterium]
MNKETKAGYGLSLKIITNVAWNFFGQIVLLIAALCVTPFIVHRLNVNLYGIYSLIGIIIGYFSFLQFGLGTAMVKYVSESIAKADNEKIRRLFWSCFFTYFFMGILGTAIIAFSAAPIVEKILKIQPDLTATAIDAVRIGSLGFLLSMLLGVMSGVIQAVGRFDILNRVGIFLGVAQLILAAGLLKLGYSLREVIISNVAVQAWGIYIYWIATVRLLPFLSRPVWDRASLVTLFKFGGFVTISGVTAPILINIEKIFLTSLRSLAALTYYAIPFGLMDRLTVIRSAFSSVLLPVFSSLDGSSEERMNKELHLRSVLYIFFLYLFFVLFFTIFAKPFLAWWVGESFIRNSASILVVLSLAGLVNALAAPSLNALQGKGKPHIPAIFHTVETIIYIPVGFFLIKKFGGLGAAFAWFLRVFFDTLLLHKATCDLLGVNIFSWYRELMYQAAIPTLVCGLLFYFLKAMNMPFFSLANICGFFIAFLLYSYSVWRWGLDNIARVKIGQYLSGLF